MFDVGKKAYLPYMWPNVQVSTQDIIYSGQGVMYDCNATGLFTTLTHIVSTEGIAELGARISGAAPFELVAFIGAVDDPTVSNYKKAQMFGKIMSTVLNYTIQ